MAGHLNFDAARFARLLWRKSVEHHLNRKNDLIDEVMTAIAENDVFDRGPGGKALWLCARVVPRERA
jgi:hypothetical protein